MKVGRSFEDPESEDERGLMVAIKHLYNRSNVVKSNNRIKDERSFLFLVNLHPSLLAFHFWRALCGIECVNKVARMSKMLPYGRRDLPENLWQLSDSTRLT